MKRWLAAALFGACAVAVIPAILGEHGAYSGEKRGELLMVIGIGAGLGLAALVFALLSRWLMWRGMVRATWLWQRRDEMRRSLQREAQELEERKRKRREDRV